jgi:UDP-N-acetylmuramate--alanine ligase
MDEFAGAFHQADRLFLMDIYAASEQPIEGVTAEALAERARAFGHKSVEYVGSTEKGIEAVVKAAEPGDLALTLGAGSVSQAGDRILKALREGN